MKAKNKEVTRLSQAIKTAMKNNGWNQVVLAEKTNLTQASVCRALSAKTDRPRPAILSRIVQCWPTPEERVIILVAHLKDEINRARMPEACLDIAPTGDHISGDIAGALRVIALADPSAYDAAKKLILNLGSLIETGDANKRIRQAAEQPEKYQAKKENK
jgi:transcriptional regulator with XRE-family HTH domain